MSKIISNFLGNYTSRTISLTIAIFFISFYTAYAGDHDDQAKKCKTLYEEIFQIYRDARNVFAKNQGSNENFYEEYKQNLLTYQIECSSKLENKSEIDDPASNFDNSFRLSVILGTFNGKLDVLRSAVGYVSKSSISKELDGLPDLLQEILKIDLKSARANEEEEKAIKEVQKNGDKIYQEIYKFKRTLNSNDEKFVDDQKKMSCTSVNSPPKEYHKKLSDQGMSSNCYAYSVAELFQDHTQENKRPSEFEVAYQYYKNSTRTNLIRGLMWAAGMPTLQLGNIIFGDDPFKYLWRRHKKPELFLEDVANNGGSECSAAKRMLEKNRKDGICLGKDFYTQTHGNFNFLNLADFLKRNKNLESSTLSEIRCEGHIFPKGFTDEQIIDITKIVASVEINDFLKNPMKYLCNQNDGRVRDQNLLHKKVVCESSKDKLFSEIDKALDSGHIVAAGVHHPHYTKHRMARGDGHSVNIIGREWDEENGCIYLIKDSASPKRPIRKIPEYILKQNLTETVRLDDIP